MVTLDINYLELEKEIKLKLEELEKVLFDIGMELDDIDGNDLKIDITPDRPDMVSLHGLVRALKAYTKGKLTNYKVKDSKYKLIIDKSVKEVRPYTVAAVIKNLKFDDQKIKEMIWVQEKLHDTFARGRKKAAIGIYPFDVIKTPIYYFAEDPKKVKFQPLEFPRELTGLEILSKHPTGRDYGHLLKGHKKFPFFKDANGEILSMPPIINSHKTGKVTEDTKEIFIECSGSDLTAIKYLLNILVTMFADMGGDIYSMTLEYPDKKIITPDLKPEERKIKVSYVNTLLGTNFSAKKIESLLTKMMYEAKATKDEIKIKVTAFRTDIWHDVDIADDVARAYGFNNLEPRVKPVASIGQEDIEAEIRRDVEQVMIGLGYTGTFTFALTSKEEQYKNMELKDKPHIKLGHTSEKSLNMVRTWLIPEMIKVLVSNRNKSYPQKLFETAEVVIPDKNTDVLSKNMLKTAIITANTSANFTEIKQVVENLLDSFDLKYEILEAEHESFIIDRCAQVKIDGKVAGIMGEISPKVLSNWKLEVPVAAFEMDYSWRK